MTDQNLAEEVDFKTLIRAVRANQRGNDYELAALAIAAIIHAAPWRADPSERQVDISVVAASKYAEPPTILFMYRPSFLTREAGLPEWFRLPVHILNGATAAMLISEGMMNSTTTVTSTNADGFEVWRERHLQCAMPGEFNEPKKCAEFILANLGDMTPWNLSDTLAPDVREKVFKAYARVTSPF